MTASRQNCVIAVALAAIAFATFWPVFRSDFVGLDDPEYVTANTHVLAGLSLEQIRWSFTNLQEGFWQPLTWLSYMLDFQVFGLQPYGFHLTNLILHAMGTVLLFNILHSMTRAQWQSAFVAALFALHPLHVEPVAWISSRKDVLSTVFWMLTIWAYARHVQFFRQSPATRFLSSRFYWLALVFFLGGLMSKTMVVTLPAILLLLDWWPLNRLSAISSEKRKAKVRTLLLEKIPFFAAAAICAIITLHAEKSAGALPAADQFPLPTRASNAVLSYTEYLFQTLWPHDLAVFYPYPQSFPQPRVAASALLLVALSGIALWLRKRRPYLVVGWFWYLISLLPVCGIIQVGTHSHADRYTYVPLVGIFVAAAWGFAELRQHLKIPRWIAATTATCTLGACIVGSRLQLTYWYDSETLFRRALAVTNDNAIVHYDLGSLLQSRNALDEAADHFREALRILPSYSQAWNNLGNVVFMQGKPGDAIECYRSALKFNPDSFEAMNNLGAALLKTGQTDEAVEQFNRVVQHFPNDPQAWYALGLSSMKQGRSDAAKEAFLRAIELRPNYPEANQKLQELGAKGSP